MNQEIKLSQEEMKEYLAYKQEKERKEQERRRKESLYAYRDLVDELVEENFCRLQDLSKMLATAKRYVLDSFRLAIEMKQELYGLKEERYTHTFTNSEGDKRIIIGVYTNDNYRDTVNEGIAMVKEAIVGMAKDEESKALVEALLKLLSKDQKGNLKAGRVLQLRQLAERIGNERLMEGVKIIESSYQPQQSKTFVRAQLRKGDGTWENIGLGMTEAL